MAYSPPDSSETFTISLTALLEGIGTLIGVFVDNLSTAVIYTYDVGLGTWSPSTPEATETDSISIDIEVMNDGAVTDTLFAEFVSADVTPAEPLIMEMPGVLVGGTSFLPSPWDYWTFTMPPNNIDITINAGHVIP